MKNNIGFIAIGQAGGNIGVLFEKAGYTVLHINTSPEDLATLTEAKHTYHIKDGEGCNKDRDKAKELIFEDFTDISEEIKQKIHEEFIYVIFSSGGGTGSGSSPVLIDLLIQHTDKKVGAITILPSPTEPLKTAINAYECFRELEEIDGIGATFVLDNGKADKFLINRNFVTLFSSLIEIPHHRNFKGNIDIAEIKELLSTRGAAIISKMSKHTSDTPRLIKSFKENIFAPLETDRVIKYIGLSACAQIDMDAVMLETGVCLDVFQGFNSENTICMLCGLTFPYTALERIRSKIDGSKEAVTKSLAATRETKLSDGINFLNEPQTSSSKSKKPKADISDVFSKYRRK